MIFEGFWRLEKLLFSWYQEFFGTRFLSVTKIICPSEPTPLHWKTPQRRLFSHPYLRSVANCFMGNMFESRLDNVWIKFTHCSNQIQTKFGANLHNVWINFRSCLDQISTKFGAIPYCKIIGRNQFCGAPPQSPRPPSSGHPLGDFGLWVQDFFWGRRRLAGGEQGPLQA